MRRNLRFLSLFLAAAALAVAWTFRVESHQGTNRVIKFAYVGSLEDARHLSALKFKERVESSSNGALKVELYYGGQLGGDRDAIEGIKLGTIQMTVAGAGIFANFEPAMGITALPYLFTTFKEAWAFTDGEFYRQITRRLLRSDMRVLGHWENGFRCITTSTHPIDSLEDLAGLKIRTPENPIILATLEALGAKPSPLPWPELYMALQQGAFDGQENPIPAIYVNKLYEIQKFISITKHVYEPMPVVISEFFWKGLSSVEQELIQSALDECQAFNRRLVKKNTTEMLLQLSEKGMVISRPDLHTFEKASRVVREQFKQTLGADRVEAAYKSVEKL